MAKKKLTKKRAKLLADLENIVGNNCYNGNIQNWGPGGIYEGEGRYFRYPLTVRDEDGSIRKRRHSNHDLTPEQIATGYYAFGANRLHITRAIEEVLQYLERNHELKL